MRFLHARTALLPSLVSLFLLCGASRADETSCWEFDGSQSLLMPLATYSGSGCAVDVTIPFLAASYAPNQSVLLLWGLQVDNASTNDMDVPMPPDVMTTLSADSQVQILSTYVRTCASPLECSPSVLSNDTFTTTQSGNISDVDATYFETTDLAFPEEGNYTVAAVAILGNAENSTLLYYFQTSVDIVVKAVQVEAPDYDGDVTYCRVTAQNSLDGQLDSTALLASSDSAEIELVLAVGEVVQAWQPLDVVWSATLTRNTSKEIQLPSSLDATYVLDDDGTEESGYYIIVGSVVKLCEKAKGCNEYSSVVDVSSADFAANFSASGTATFNASGIVLPSTGSYAGFVQVTLAGDADSQRYDFIKYFEVFADAYDVAEQVESATYADDGTESYCWEVVAAADDMRVHDSSAVFAGNSTNCPYTVYMKVNTTTFTVGDNALVTWTIAKQTSYVGTDGVVGNMTTVYDDATAQYVNLPQINLYYCNDTNCSPFAKKKTLAYAARPMNFSEISGEALLASRINIPTEGTYALMVHVVVPNGDGLRFDVASFVRLTVTASSASAISHTPSKSHVGLILGATLGCASVVCLAVLGLVVVHRRRAERRAAQQKERRHSFFGFRPLSFTNELPTNSPASGHGSDESGHFMYVKAQRSPLDMPRASSLSYDPYSRRSFVEADLEDSSLSFSISDLETPSNPSEKTTQPQQSPATTQF